MQNKREQSRLRAFIAKLMAGSTEEEIVSAEQSFRAYIALAQRIAKRKVAERAKVLDEEENLVKHESIIN
jgi:ribosomal protein S20